jgi:hypothetical protein
VTTGRTITGRVTRVDASRGTLTLDSAEVGTLNLQAQPSALATVRPGDTIVVEIVPTLR